MSQPFDAYDLELAAKFLPKHGDAVALLQPASAPFPCVPPQNALWPNSSSDVFGKVRKSDRKIRFFQAVDLTLDDLKGCRRLAKVSYLSLSDSLDPKVLKWFAGKAPKELSTLHLRAEQHQPHMATLAHAAADTLDALWLDGPGMVSLLETLQPDSLTLKHVGTEGLPASLTARWITVEGDAALVQAVKERSSAVSFDVVADDAGAAEAWLSDPRRGALYQRQPDGALAFLAQRHSDGVVYASQLLDLVPTPPGPSGGKQVRFQGSGQVPAEVFAWAGVEELVLEGMSLPLEQLTDGAPLLASLRSVAMTKAQLTDRHVPGLLRLLASAQLTKLDLRRNGIQDSGAFAAHVGVIDLSLQRTEQPLPMVHSDFFLDFRNVPFRSVEELVVQWGEHAIEATYELMGREGPGAVALGAGRVFAQRDRGDAFSTWAHLEAGIRAWFDGFKSLREPSGRLDAHLNRGLDEIERVLSALNGGYGNDLYILGENAAAYAFRSLGMLAQWQPDGVLPLEGACPFFSGELAQGLIKLYEHEKPVIAGQLREWVSEHA